MSLSMDEWGKAFDAKKKADAKKKSDEHPIMCNTKQFELVKQARAQLIMRGTKDLGVDITPALRSGSLAYGEMAAIGALLILDKVKQ